MSATLRFLSYVRRGLARSFGEAADANGVPRSDTASVDVAPCWQPGTETTRTVTVRGPGAVVALAPDEVLRVDPPDGAATPSRATSRAPSCAPPTCRGCLPRRVRAGERLMPWLVLAVVEEREGVTFADGVLTVDDAGPRAPRPG